MSSPRASTVLLAVAVLGLGGCGAATHTTSIQTVVDTVTVPSQSTGTLVTITSTSATSTTTTAATQSVATAAAPPTCDSTMWSVTPASSQGAAGTIYINFTIRNTAGFACSTYGYPGIALIAASGRVLPGHATRIPPTSTLPEKPVTIPASGIAGFTVSYSDVDRTPGACAAAAAVQVIPPNTSRPVVARFPASGELASGIPTCSREIRVSAVST